MKWLAVASVILGCNLGCVPRLGSLPAGAGRVLTDDGQLGTLGPHAVEARGTAIGGFADSIPVVVYRPTDGRGPLPAVVFLPGRVAPESQYESYARALASHGFVVAVRGWYSPFHTDRELSADALTIADWLVARGLADPKRLGVAGHSMGAKDAILAAAQSKKFQAVVALDPDDNGRLSVAHGAIRDLGAALLLVGAEVAWKASSVCAPKEHNYQRFFEHAPAGTVELTLKDADHVQVMDDPTQLGMGICRCGGADSKVVRTLARQATVAWFRAKLEHVATAPLALGSAGSLRVQKAPAQLAVTSPATR